MRFRKNGDPGVVLPSVRRCEEQAVAVYFWPTFAPMPVCERHLEQMKWHARQNGFELLYEKSAPKTGCQQLVRRDQ